MNALVAVEAREKELRGLIEVCQRQCNGLEEELEATGKDLEGERRKREALQVLIIASVRRGRGFCVLF